MSDGRKEWHLSRTVPLAYLGGILLQTLALGWFVAMLRADIEANKDDLLQHTVRLNAAERSIQNQAVFLARIDENLKAIRAALERIRLNEESK